MMRLPIIQCYFTAMKVDYAAFLFLITAFMSWYSSAVKCFFNHKVRQATNGCFAAKAFLAASMTCYNVYWLLF